MLYFSYISILPLNELERVLVISFLLEFNNRLEET